MLKVLIRFLRIGGFVGVAAACNSTGAVAANSANVAAEIAQCQVAGRAADAGQNLHVYNECMQAAGFRDGGAQ